MLNSEINATRCILLDLFHYTVQHVTILNTVGSCNTMVSSCLSEHI